MTTTNLNTKLINAIIGSKEEVEFLQNKLAFLEKLTNEYDSIYFEERLQDIIDTSDEISFDGLIYQIYKNIGELAINYLLCSDEWFQEYGISNYDVIEIYNIPAPSGLNTVFDSILSKFDLENITDSDIKDFKHEIIEDFNLHQKYFSNTSVFEFKNESELAKHIKFCESFLNYHLLKDTQYIVEIYETDDIYEDNDDESLYDGKPMYEGKLIHKDTEEELDDSLTGRYCEISSVFEDLLGYINNEILNQTQEIDDWLEDSCCPKCKGFDYEEEDIEHSASDEHFRRWNCSCGAVWQERYNLTKVFYDNKEVEVTSEEFDNLAFENKKMAYFIEKLGLSIDDITDNIISGDNDQLNEAIKKATQTPCFLVNRHIAQSVLVLFNNELGHSDSKFIHDCDNQKILVELGGDLEDEEFEDSYKKLFKLIKKPNRNNFYICY